MPPRTASLLPLIRAALAGTSALALVATAQAQDVGQESVSDDQSTDLETLVVNGSGGVITAEGYVATSSATGAKVDTPFLETPQSISTVTEQQLKDRNPQTLLETLAYTPGTRVGAYGFDPRFDAFFVRGFDVTFTGVFRDNLRQPAAVDSVFKTEPYGLEGVSILRGPSSALYGATGAGGLYNLITKRPTEEMLREVQVQYGNHDRYQGQFDFSGPVNETDPIYYRLTGLLRDADTEQVGLSDDRAYIAPAFTWKPDEDTKLTVLSEYSRTKSGGTATYYNDPLTGEVTDIFAGNPDFNDSIQKQGRIGYEFEHRLNDTFVFRQNARVSTLNIDADWAFAYAPNAADPTLLDSSAGTYDERLTAFVIDNQLEAKFDTGAFEHTLVAGVDYTKLRFRALDGRGVSPPLDTKNPTKGRPVEAIDFDTRTVQDQWQLGTYLQDQIRYDAWTLDDGRALRLGLDRYGHHGSGHRLANHGIAKGQGVLRPYRTHLSDGFRSRALYQLLDGIHAQCRFQQGDEPAVQAYRERAGRNRHQVSPAEQQHADYGSSLQHRSEEWPVSRSRRGYCNPGSARKTALARFRDRSEYQP